MDLPIDDKGAIDFDYKVIARFWSKVSVGRDGVCWIWNAARSEFGHGTFYFPSEKGPIPIGAHRFAYMLSTKKPIPKGTFICHHCDNPRCCNPDHLFEGTQKDNMQDAWAKKRLRQPPIMRGDASYLRSNPEKVLRGSKSPNTSMNEEKVLELLQKRAAGASTQELMDYYGLGRSTVGFICAGRSWAHVHKMPGAPTRVELDAVRQNKTGRAKLSSEQVKEIRKLLDQGVTGRQLAADFNVSPATIVHIKKGYSWKLGDDEATS